MTHRIPTTSPHATRLHSSSYLQHQRPVHRIRTYPSFNGIQPLQHEKTILEVNEVTKIHKRDTSSSYEEFLRYTHPYDFILPTSTTYPVHNETPKAFSEQATLSIFIHEGRPTTTKLTLVDLPSSIDNSTCYECSKGIPFLLLTSHHKPLTKQVVIILYSLHLGRKIASPSTSTIRWKKERESTPKKSIYSTSKHTTTFQVGTQSSNSLIKPTRKLLVRAFTSSSKLFTSIPRLIPEFSNPTSTTNHVTSSYGIYSTALATRTTSVTIEVKINKSLHSQVNRLNIHRVTSITT